MALLASATANEEAFAVACTVTGFSGSYGAVSLLSSSAVPTTATFTVSCNGGTSGQALRFCMSIGPGSTTTGSSGERVLRSSSAYIDHELYADAAHSHVWGSWGISVSSPYPSSSPAGIQQDVTLDGAGSGAFTFTVYAQILANQAGASLGSYTWTGSGPTVQYRPLSGSTACPTTGGSTDGATMTLTATIAGSCTVSTTAVNFGSVSSLGGNIDSTGTLTVQCTNLLPYNVKLDAGLGSGATVANRKMTSGAYTVNYSLYQDNARTIVWGQTVGTNTLSSTGSGSNQVLTVYGRAPSQTTPAPGSYSDTVVVTITY
jgi:spore coat protein U-like protein